jgi:hypothetical protein
MENDTDPKPQPKGLVQWATTPPQSYAVFLVCLLAVWLLSFYAGSLAPKKPAGLGPPPLAAPRN